MVPIKACETARKKAVKARRQKGDDDLMAASLCVGFGRGRKRGGEVEVGVRGWKGFDNH